MKSFCRKKLPQRELRRRIGYATLIWACVQACNAPKPTCWGTCEEQGECGSGLTCDTLLGYCVQEVGNPANIEACELERREVWVCAEHNVQFPLNNESSNDEQEVQSVDVRGLPKNIDVSGNQVTGSFAKGEHVIAWGDAPARRVLQIHATRECPALEVTSQPRACVGRPLSATLKATGGTGDVTWNLVGDTHGYTISHDGKLEGVATQDTELDVALEDERNVRVETKLRVQAIEGCPSIETTTLPAGCVDSVFEWSLDVNGFEPEFRTPTIISDDPARDLAKLQLEITKIDDHSHRLRARPREDATGNYTLGLVVDNDEANDQVEVPFEVRTCPEESAVICCGEEVNVPLGPGTWTLTSPDNNPMRPNVAILGGNQLSFKRGALQNAHYTLNLNNPNDTTESVRVVLSSPGNAGCETAMSGDADAGAATMTTPDGSAPSLTALADGCVGVDYWQQVLSPHEDASLAPEIEGLHVVDGVLRGVPNEAFAGDVWLSILNTATGKRSRRGYQLTVRETCRFAVLDTSSESRQLFLHSLAPNEPPVQVSFLPNHAVDVGAFSFSPDGSTLAFVAMQLDTEADAGEPASEHLYVVPSDATTPDDVLDLGSLNGKISEIVWSPNSTQLGALVGSGDATQMAIVPRTGAGYGAPRFVPIEQARGLFWFDDNHPCVRYARAVDLNDPDEDARAVTCAVNTGAGTFDETVAALSSSPYDVLQPKVSELGILYFQKMVASDGGFFWFWDPLQRASYPTESSVQHQSSLFASPNGRWVATSYDENHSINIAASNLPTEFPERFEPSAEIEHCENVVTWSASGRELACVNLRPDELVLVRLTEKGNIRDQHTFDLSLTPNLSLPILLARSVFSANGDWFVFDDDSTTDMGVIDMRGEPEEWQMQRFAFEHDGYDLGLEPLQVPPDSFVLASSRLHVFAPAQNQLLPLAAPEPRLSPSCEWYFQTNGFDGWCGGDAPRRFVPSPDSQSALLLDNLGQVQLLDLHGSARIVALSTGSCGSGQNNCDHLFAFAPTRFSVAPTP